MADSDYFWYYIELGELIGDPKSGRLLHRLVHQFPKREYSTPQFLKTQLIRFFSSRTSSTCTTYH